MLRVAGNSLGYGVCAVAFRGSDDLYQLFFGYAVLCTAGLYFKRSFGQRARLVEDYRIDFGNGIQVITAFEQYTQAGCGADTAEVSQRNADYQSARA